MNGSDKLRKCIEATTPTRIMKNESENKVTNIKKADNARRTELAMLDIWIEKYPNETAAKLQKYRARQTVNQSNIQSDLQKEKSL